MSTTETVETELQRRLMSPDRRREGRVLETLPKIVCADGLTLSVQSSGFHYCSPRDNDGPWHSVEVGFPNRPVDEFLQYAEDENRPTDTVYGYVPLSVVAKVVVAHGGFAVSAELA